MKIAKLETFGNEFVCFVKATADTGDVGWGQTSTYHADITAEVFHRQIAPHALDRDALDLEDTLNLIQEREHKFPGSYLRRAMAGLDTALWDLRGRIERMLMPITSRLGFRTEFPFERYAAWAASQPGVELIERRPLPPLGHFELLRFRKH